MTRLALDQGRAGDAQHALLAELDKWPRHNVLLAMAALTHAEVGEGDEACRIVDSLAADDYRRVKLGGTSTTFAYLSDAVAVLAAHQRAACLYDVYAPYAGLAAVPGLLGVHCPGAVDRYLGQLSATLGRWDDAQRHYEAALVFEEGLRAPPLHARTRYWYARMLVERGRPGDAERATALASAAVTTAEELGMTRLAAQAAELR